MKTITLEQLKEILKRLESQRKIDEAESMKSSYPQMHRYEGIEEGFNLVEKEIEKYFK